MSLIGLLLFVVATPGDTCPVNLIGEPDLVEAVRSRIDLAQVAQTACAPITIHLSGDEAAVSIAVEDDGRRSVRTVTDIDMACVLIESWTFVPFEARLPRRVVRPIDSAAAHRHRRAIKIEGPQFLVAGLAEVSVGNDGSVWYGPAVEGAVTDGAWTTGTLLRYARNDGGIGNGYMLGFEQSFGRDFRWGLISLEPRVGFSLRTMQRSAYDSWISPCGALSCTFQPGEVVDRPRTEGTSVLMSLGARTTIVLSVVDRVSLWASVGLATPIAGNMDIPFAGPDHELTLGRFAFGGRFRL